MKRRVTSSCLLVSSLCLAGILAAGSAESRVQAPREVRLSLEGIARIRVEATVGNLTVRAVAGIDEIRATGMASAPDPAMLDTIGLTAARDGDRALIRGVSPGMVPKSRVFVADAPEGGGRGKGKKEDLPEEPQGSLELTLNVPADLPLDITAVWGDITIEGAAATTVSVNRGNVAVSDLTGNLKLMVDIGDVTVTRVAGEVVLTTGDGETIVNIAGGNVTVTRNPFGESRFINVGGTLHIASDGIGDIMAKQVGGDLIVEDDAGGGIRHEEVRGRIRIPEPGPPKHVREKLQKKAQSD